ncbi:MAG: TonB-dependent receptor plug domain-containing protein, partial [Crocinitomicaceae bacterium]
MKNIWTALGLIIIFNFSSFSQQITITGNVTDDKDAPLPNVKVVEKGTNNGVLTDFDGNYSITTNNSEELTLSYFFIGFDKQEIVVAGRTKIDVKMSTDSQILEEVVIVGYGSSRSKELTGAAAKVKGENIEKLNLSRMDQALQGQVSGVNISTNSGSPGGASSIRIRGLSTFGDNDPLILVDGVVYDSEGLNALNPADIESVNVLKDATAGIYGVRAANGVIIIETKKGKIGGKPQIEFSAYRGIQETAKRLDLLTAEEYAVIKNEMFAFGGQEMPFPNTALGVGTNWQDTVFQSAPVESYSLSI